MSWKQATMLLAVVFGTLLVCDVEAKATKPEERRMSDPARRGNDCSAFYSYNRKSTAGPKWWHMLSTCYDACDGDRQTPIDIVPVQTTYERGLPKIKLASEKRKIKTTIYNNKNLAPHFDAVSVDKVPRIQLSSPLTDANFAFASLHIHVGRGRGKGSEHSMDGKFAPMEAHMVFFNEDLGTTIGEAVSKPDGLMVIGVFIQEAGTEVMSNDRTIDNTLTDDECPTRNATKLSKLMESAFSNKAVHDFDENQSQKLSVNIRLSDILPQRKDRKYFAYKGSLTTPPCTENVQWIVMKCPVVVSSKAFDALRDVEADDQGMTLGTWGTRRPIQDINHRQVLRNFK